MVHIFIMLYVQVSREKQNQYNGTDLVNQNKV